jgi:hypothetical protein
MLLQGLRSERAKHNPAIKYAEDSWAEGRQFTTNATDALAVAYPSLVKQLQTNLSALIPSSPPDPSALGFEQLDHHVRYPLRFTLANGGTGSGTITFDNSTGE